MSLSLSSLDTLKKQAEEWCAMVNLEKQNQQLSVEAINVLLTGSFRTSSSLSTKAVDAPLTQGEVSKTPVLPVRQMKNWLANLEQKNKENS